MDYTDLLRAQKEFYVPPQPGTESQGTKSPGPTQAAGSQDSKPPTQPQDAPPHDYPPPWVPSLPLARDSSLRDSPSIPLSTASTSTSTSSQPRPASSSYTHYPHAQLAGVEFLSFPESSSTKPYHQYLVSKFKSIGAVDWRTRSFHPEKVDAVKEIIARFGGEKGDGLNEEQRERVREWVLRRKAVSEEKAREEGERKVVDRETEARERREKYRAQMEESRRHIKVREVERREDRERELGLRKGVGDLEARAKEGLLAWDREFAAELGGGLAARSTCEREMKEKQKEK